MFLTEKELREAFWDNYNYSGRALKYQFECPIRDGSADLVTVEKFQGNYQINAFEFKLSDIRKALLQAKGNIPFANKSWIVIPEEKVQFVKNKYASYLTTEKYIGVIAVSEGGKWEMVYRPHFQKEIRLNQALLNLIIGAL